VPSDLFNGFTDFSAFSLLYAFRNFGVMVAVVVGTLLLSSSGALLLSLLVKVTVCFESRPHFNRNNSVTMVRGQNVSGRKRIGSQCIGYKTYQRTKRIGYQTYRRQTVSDTKRFVPIPVRFVYVPLQKSLLVTAKITRYVAVALLR
jgi:hypothetical protein